MEPLSNPMWHHQWRALWPAPANAVRNAAWKNQVLELVVRDTSNPQVAAARDTDLEACPADAWWALWREVNKTSQTEILGPHTVSRLNADPDQDLEPVLRRSQDEKSLRTPTRRSLVCIPGPHNAPLLKRVLSWMNDNNKKATSANTGLTHDLEMSLWMELLVNGPAHTPQQRADLADVLYENLPHGVRTRAVQHAIKYDDFEGWLISHLQRHPPQGGSSAMDTIASECAQLRPSLLKVLEPRMVPSDRISVILEALSARAHRPHAAATCALMWPQGYPSTPHSQPTPDRATQMIITGWDVLPPDVLMGAIEQVHHNPLWPPTVASIVSSTSPHEARHTDLLGQIIPSLSAKDLVGVVDVLEHQQGRHHSAHKLLPHLTPDQVSVLSEHAHRIKNPVWSAWWTKTALTTAVSTPQQTSSAWKM